MAFNIKTTIGQIAGWLQKTGYVKATRVGEPKSPPQGELFASVFMNSVRLVKFYLNGGTQEIHSVQVRLYRNMLADNEDTEYILAKAVSEITSALLGDFDLGSNIRNVDAAGEHGQGMTATWGYIDVGGTMYRVVDLVLPLVVDDSATAAA